MSTAPWRFAVDIQREDHAPVRQVEVLPDWEPLFECVRFLALRQGAEPAAAFALDCCIEPVWHARRRAPYLEAIRAQTCGDAGAPLSITVDVDCFTAPARAVVAQLVMDGVLQNGDPVRCLPMAFARHAGGAQNRERRSAETAQHGRFRMQSRPPALTLRHASLRALLACATAPPHSSAEETDEVPVFIPQAVIDDVVELTRRVHGTFEIGGLLAGHLCRDVDGSGIYVEVTAQIPARHVEATAARLTFTSDTWTEFRAALELRRRGEIMLGWWHSHPVRAWCKDCPEKKQRTCALRRDYFSTEDRLLQRAMFPRAYSLGLVVNDIAHDDATLSLFGWHRGSIEPRGYHVLDAAPATVADAAATQEDAPCATTS